jgi:hypothetical protein
VGQQSVEAAWQYALNRFAVDPQRVCLAGEGTGATLCASVALMTSRMDVQAVAINPRQYSKIKDFPLSLLEDWGDDQPPKRKLSVISNDLDQNWWVTELKEYNSIGMETMLQSAEFDPWKADHQRNQLIRAALGMSDAAAPNNAAKRQFLQAKFGGAKEFHWLRMMAVKLTTEQYRVTVIGPHEKIEGDDIEKIDYSIDLEQMTRGRLPLCPGAFGGTTILVLDGEHVGDLEKWMQLETSDPLTARSRFHRTRIAVQDEVAMNANTEERSLTNVLGKLLGENRKNVLIVPAQFYSGPEAMTKLADAAAPFSDQMTIHWLPGLGGEMRGN